MPTFPADTANLITAKPRKTIILKPFRPLIVLGNYSTFMKMHYKVTKAKKLAGSKNFTINNSLNMVSASSKLTGLRSLKVGLDVMIVCDGRD